MAAKTKVENVIEVCFSFFAHNSVRVAYLFLYVQDILLCCWLADSVIHYAKTSLPWLFWLGFMLGIIIDVVLTLGEIFGAVNFFKSTKILHRNDDLLEGNDLLEAVKRRNATESRLRLFDERILTGRIVFLKTLQMVGVLSLIVESYKYLPIGLIHDSCVLTLKLWFGLFLLILMIIRLISLRNMRLKQEKQNPPRLYLEACRLKPLCFVFTLMIIISAALYIVYFVERRRYPPTVLESTPCYPATGKSLEDLKLQPLKIDAVFGKKVNVTVFDWHVGSANQTQIRLKNSKYYASIFVEENSLRSLYARVIDDGDTKVILPVEELNVHHLNTGRTMELYFAFNQSNSPTKNRICRVLIKFGSDGNVTYNFHLGRFEEREEDSWDPTKCFKDQFYHNNFYWSESLLRKTVDELCPHPINLKHLKMENLFSRKLEISMDNPWCSSECTTCKFVSPKRDYNKFKVVSECKAHNFSRDCVFKIGAMTSVNRDENEKDSTTVSSQRHLTQNRHSGHQPCPKNVLATSTSFNQLKNQRIKFGENVSACGIVSLKKSGCDIPKERECKIRFSESRDEFNVEEFVKLRMTSCLNVQPAYDVQLNLQETC